MNKHIIIGIIILLVGIAAHYLIETTAYGFYIGGLMGSGGVLIITGVAKQFE